MAKGLFHVSMIVDAGSLYAVTSAAAAGKASDVQITPVPDSAKKKSDDATPRIPVKAVLMPWWAKQKQFEMRAAIQLGEEHGYTKGGVYTATLAAMKDGLLVRTGPGSYKTTPALAKAVKTMAKSNGAAPASKPAKAAREQHNTGHGDFVLQLINRGEVTYKSIRQAFADDGRVPRSIDGAIGRLKKDKLIANSGPGEYKLLAKGTEHLKSLT